MAFRAMTIVSEIVMLTFWHWVEKDIYKRANKVDTYVLQVIRLCISLLV